MRHHKSTGFVIILLPIAALLLWAVRLGIKLVKRAVARKRLKRSIAKAGEDATRRAIERERKAAHFKAKYPRQYWAAGIVAKRK